MSSRLNPREYDLGELRDAVREAPGRRDDGTGDGRGDGRLDARSAVEDLLLGEANDDPQARRTADTRSDGRPAEQRRSGDDTDATDDTSGAAARRRTARASVGRSRRKAARVPRSSSPERTPDGDSRRREVGDGERSRRRSPDDAGDPGRARSASPERGAHLGDLGLLAAGSGGDVERPYLDRLPDAYRAQLEVFAWLEGLLGACGRGATAEALAYYESVGWLSEGAREDLEDFLAGLSAAEPPDPRPLGVDDHRESLRYVARLAGRGDR